MAGDGPEGVGERPSRVARVAGAVARRAARHAARRGLRALLAKGTATTAQAAAANPAVAGSVAAALAIVGALLLVTMVVVIAVFGLAGAAAAACGADEPTSGTIRVSKGEPPRELIPWLVAAANGTNAQLGPRGAAVLAGIAKVESDFGRSRARGIHSGVNFANCCAGPFQFNLRDTWAGYADDPGADADGDGTVSVYSFPDAAFAAARKLDSQGAPEDWNAALHAYNRSWRYVRKVLEYADRYQGPMAYADGVALAAVEEPPPSPAECDAGTSLSLENAPPDALGRIEYIADWIEAERIPYCYGGGHDPRPGPDNNGNTYCWTAGDRRIKNSQAIGIDCSGSVRWLLVLTGYPDPGPIVSGQFAGAYPRGPGKHVTIWSNDGHVFIEINGRFWGTSGSNFANGPGWTNASTDGFVASHPPGL